MTRTQNIYDFAVIGNGLSAKLFIQRICEESGDFKILQLSHEDFAPSCTQATTSVITLNGIKSGISPLGNILYKAYHHTINYLEKMNPPGVEKCLQRYIAKGVDEIFQLEKRFAEQKDSFINISDHLVHFDYECITFNAPVFTNWLDNKNSEYQNLYSLKRFVTNIGQKPGGIFEISVQESEVFLARKIILCTGAYSKFLNFTKNQDLTFTKAVSGSYLQCQRDLETTSFVYSFKGFNLIYRSLDKTILIGGDSNKNFIMAPHVSAVREFYEACLAHVENFVNFPTFDEFVIKTGLRHKGRKRQPFWGEVIPGVYSIHSLYKNGFTYAFLAAEEIVKSGTILDPT